MGGREKDQSLERKFHGGRVSRAELSEAIKEMGDPWLITLAWANLETVCPIRHILHLCRQCLSPSCSHVKNSVLIRETVFIVHPQLLYLGLKFLRFHLVFISNTML